MSFLRLTQLGLFCFFMKVVIYSLLIQYCSVIGHENCKLQYSYLLPQFASDLHFCLFVLLFVKSSEAFYAD